VTGQLTGEMLRVLRIAERDGGSVVAGKGAHAGRVERVNAATVLALIRRGLLSHVYGSEGGLGGRLTDAGRAAIAGHAEPPVHATKKSAAQLDAEIAEALAEPSSTERAPLRVQLSKGLGQAIRRYSGLAVFNATKNTSRGYVFESNDPGVVRAFWYATNEVLHRPATRAIGDAVVKLRAELRPIIEASWPEALSR